MSKIYPVTEDNPVVDDSVIEHNPIMEDKPVKKEFMVGSMFLDLNSEAMFTSDDLISLLYHCGELTLTTVEMARISKRINYDTLIRHLSGDRLYCWHEDLRRTMCSFFRELTYQRIAQVEEQELLWDLIFTFEACLGDLTTVKVIMEQKEINVRCMGCNAYIFALQHHEEMGLYFMERDQALLLCQGVIPSPVKEYLKYPSHLDWIIDKFYPEDLLEDIFQQLLVCSRWRKSAIKRIVQENDIDLKQILLDIL